MMISTECRFCKQEQVLMNFADGYSGHVWERWSEKRQEYVLGKTLCPSKQRQDEIREDTKAAEAEVKMLPAKSTKKGQGQVARKAKVDA